MRVTLADPTLARHAGQFVWLELNFDHTANREFLVRQKTAFTPSLYVLDPATERPLASHLGGMGLAALDDFLDLAEARGARSAADSALARGDELQGGGRLSEAAAEYRRALSLAAPDWPHRPYAVSQLTWALMTTHDNRACTDVAAAEAPRMKRDHGFARVALAGLMSADAGDSADWAIAARRDLAPLAVEAVELKDATRDNHFELQQALMDEASLRGDSAGVEQWGQRWLREIDAITPASEDERSALDVARMDAVSGLGTKAAASGAIPAFEASARAMPKNYNARLRLAQAQMQAERYDDALASCDRGLALSPGPLGRTWLLETQAQVWMAKGDAAAARGALDRAEESAQAINTPNNRDSNLRRIARMKAEAEQARR